MKDLIINIVLTLVMVACVFRQVRSQDDFSDPIKCFYCFGPAENSSCADPVNPRLDKGNALQVIDCPRGICLKWTHYSNNVLHMHRTCSHRLNHFRIMMIDGVCRTERNGNGYLCMCGRHLCNTAVSMKTNRNMSTLVIAAFLSGLFGFGVNL